MSTGVDGQSQTNESLLDLILPFPKRVLIFCEQKEIIHETQVGRAAQFPFDEVVEAIQAYIAPELAGQVANGQTAPVRRRSLVVPIEVHHLIHIRQHSHTAGNDLVTEPQYILILDLAGQYLMQDGVVYGWKELADIALQLVRELSRELLRTVQGAVSTLADAVGVAVEDETSFKERFDQVTERMMDDTITEGCGGDQAALRLVDEETGIGSGAIREIL